MRQLPLAVVVFLVLAVAWALCQDAPANEYAVGCSGAVASCGGIQAACSGFEGVQHVHYVQRVPVLQRLRAKRLARVQSRIESRQAVGCGG